ncbi:MAG: 1-acyl-sn-glycerol-3-phosphate acyltransferase [Kiritimatiellae bacterium]|nr:1-acyl-sn-glycerol-3-phosphate acyltransferase [Kiritimatiellia bacterium]
MGNAPRRLWVRLLRSVVALLFFLAFGVGGLILGCILFPPLMLFRARRAMRALVRACYRLFVWAARMTGMIRVVLSPEDRARFAAMRGRVVVASHPSLIDVVILLAYLPNATAVAKAAAGRNFFYSRVVNAAFLVNDDPRRVLDEAKDLLARGGNLVIFPEGTRTPADAPARKLHRGAAQIALHAGAPVPCVSVTCDPPVLAKGQPWWDVGDRVVTYTLRVCGEIPVAAPEPGTVPHAAAVALTERIRGLLFPPPADGEKT